MTLADQLGRFDLHPATSRFVQRTRLAQVAAFTGRRREREPVELPPLR